MIPWLTGKVAGPVLGAVALGLAGALLAQWLIWSTRVADLNAAIGVARSDLAAANTNAGICHANIATLDVSVKMQGADIRALADATTKASADAAKRMAAIAAQGKAAAATAKQILDLPRPSPELSCIEAERLLRGDL